MPVELVFSNKNESEGGYITSGVVVVVVVNTGAVGGCKEG